MRSLVFCSEVRSVTSGPGTPGGDPPESCLVMLPNLRQAKEGVHSSLLDQGVTRPDHLTVKLTH
jgi:hypothetical protein